MAPLAQAKNVTRHVNLFDRNARLIGDEGRLQQIVWNLLSNASKFTPAGGSIVLEACAREGQYEVSVTDTGRGIDSRFLPHLFDRFRQQDCGSNKSYSGLGIGLTIVKPLADVHNGSIEAHSQGEGSGSTFIAKIPLTDRHVRPAPDERSGSASSRLERMRVLVVDDDEDTRAFIVRILTDAGARVLEACSGDEALAQIHDGAHNLLISDKYRNGQAGWLPADPDRARSRLPRDGPASYCTHSLFARRGQGRCDQRGFSGPLGKTHHLVSTIARLRRPLPTTTAPSTEG